MWATRLAFALLFTASPVLAVSKADLEARIQQLEKKLNRVLLDQNDQANRHSREMQQLRGEIEVQSHELTKLKKKQTDLYLDIDRRLNLKQSGQGTSPVYTGDTGGAWQSGASPSPGNDDASDDGMARQDYDRALVTLKKGQYDQALVQFRMFLKQHPDSSYADNAQYWVGEVYYVTRKFPEALQEFDSVIKRYPNSTKIADARLKIGFINYELKQWAAARSALEQVISGYAGSTPARLATERLQRMSEEGH